jgi:hypothetical protein
MMSENTPGVNNTAEFEEREARLHELALRLATYPGDPRGKDPQLLVGQLPANSPVTIPFPEQSNLLGTLVRGPEHATIVLDAPFPPGGVLDFYREQLTAAGWEELPQPGPFQGGFTHTSRDQASYATFCHGKRGPALMIAVLKKDTNADVRLELDLSGQACAQRRYRHIDRDLYATLPRLLPPPGAQQLSSGGSSGDHEVSTQATLKLDTEMEIAQLSTHYTAQLEQAGWRHLEEGQNGPIAWHTWQFHDQDNELWRGTFFVLKQPTPQPTYRLYLEAIWDGDSQSTGGGWSWSASSTGI